MSTQYKAAIIGCGSIGHAHMEGYNLVDEVEVVAVADPVAAARGHYVKQYGIPQQYESVEEMLKNARPDIVSICTWHLLHPAPTIAAAQAEVKAVICEKTHGYRYGSRRFHGQRLPSKRDKINHFSPTTFHTRLGKSTPTYQGGGHWHTALRNKQSR